MGTQAATTTGSAASSGMDDEGTTASQGHDHLEHGNSHREGSGPLVNYNDRSTTDTTTPRQASTVASQWETQQSSHSMHSIPAANAKLVKDDEGQDIVMMLIQHLRCVGEHPGLTLCQELKCLTMTIL